METPKPKICICSETFVSLKPQFLHTVINYIMYVCDIIYLRLQHTNYSMLRETLNKILIHIKDFRGRECLFLWAFVATPKARKSTT